MPGIEKAADRPSAGQAHRSKPQHRACPCIGSFERVGQLAAAQVCAGCSSSALPLRTHREPLVKLGKQLLLRVRQASGQAIHDCACALEVVKGRAVPHLSGLEVL